MLYRSLYFLFHDKQTLSNAIDDLKKNLEFKDTQFHAITSEGHTLTELPGATIHRKSPIAMRVEKALWYTSIAIFVSALIALALTLLAAAWYWAIFFGVLVFGSQLSGYLFGNRIPNAQLDRFRTGLEQGDIVLQVDVPHSQVRPVKDFINEAYPKAKTNISNWHVGTIGL
jgi:hypothetical protein